MGQVICNITMKFNVSKADLEAAWLPVAQPISEVPGLRWKIFIMNDAEKEVGGVYLFDDEASVQAFLNGPIVAAVASSPDVSDITVKQFSVMEAHTAITRGPVGQVVRI